MKWQGWHTLALVAMMVGIVLSGTLIPREDRLVSWLVTLTLLAVFITIAGQGVTGLWRGVLIDERN